MARRSFQPETPEAEIGRPAAQRQESHAPQPEVMDGPAGDREAIATGIAHLRGLDLAGLRASWHSTTGRNAPAHLPKHLLFRILAYRLQADRLGDLNRDTQRLLERIGAAGADGAKGPPLQLGSAAGRPLRPGTIVMREWQGVPQRVMVLTDGFAWKGEVYGSLSEVAFAITGTRWNGPRFFGLRDKPKNISVGDGS